MLQAEWKLSPADFRLISEAVYNHCGISLHEGKHELVQARLAKEVRDGGFASIDEYVKAVLADSSGANFTRLIDALSTNLTSFFREKQHFDYLSRSVIPKLVARNGGRPAPRLLAWSAACSSGEEPYSLAITLAEALADAESASGRPRPAVDGLAGPAGWDVRILATDISTRMLATARAGMYAAPRLTSVPPEIRQTYFGRSDTGFLTGKRKARASDEDVFQIRPFVQRMIRFRHLNLMDAWPFEGPFHFIFCRNVMIYFDKITQERLIARFWNCLESGGLLFTGHSESLTGISHKFDYVQPSIYRKP